MSTRSERGNRRPGMASEPQQIIADKRPSRIARPATSPRRPGLQGPRRVPNAPLRAAVLASPLTYTEICYRLGWTRAGRGASTDLLVRLLGIQSTQTKKRIKGEIVNCTSTQSTIDIDRAITIADAIHIDFDELYEGLLPDQPTSGEECILCAADLLRHADDGLCGLCREEQNMVPGIQARRAA